MNENQSLLPTNSNDIIYNSNDISHNINTLYSKDSISLLEGSIKWESFIADNLMSAIFSFCIFYIICAIKNVHILNDIETGYLFITSVCLIYYMNLMRWNKNLCDEISFGNFSMLIILGFYNLIEIIYYVFNFISIVTSCENKIIQVINSFGELFFVCCLLPFLIIINLRKIKNENFRLKLFVKIIIFLTMVGCIISFTRKTKYIYVNSRSNKSHTSCNRTLLFKSVHGISISGSDFLKCLDVSYFVFCFILLLNPINNLNKKRAIAITNENSPKSLSMFEWLALARFRWLTVLLSFGIVSVINVTLYFTVNLLSEDKLGEYDKQLSYNVYNGLFIGAELIAIVYGVLYYLLEIRHWKKEIILKWKSDRYLNYLTTIAQLAFLVTSLINTFDNINKTGTISMVHYIQFAQYGILILQIAIQFVCVNSTCKRIVVKHPGTDSGTVKYKLISPLILAAFNIVSMFTIMQYFRNPEIISYHNSSYDGYRFWSDFIIPFCLLNRFHGVTFFINLVVKQW